MAPEAVWFTAPHTVEVRAEPMPPLRDGCLRVRSIVSGISAGSELLVLAGAAPADLEADLPTASGGFELPMKFGYASVGRVVEVGDGVTAYAAGDLVFAYHPHQTEFVVPADLAVRLPAGPPPEVAVLTANLETALTLALDTHPRVGESVLVTGQGIVGLLTSALLRRAGAGLVVTADVHEVRRQASLRMGAHHVLPAGPAVADEARALTDGRGVDVAIDLSGTAAGLQACIDAAAFGGTVVVGSWYGRGEVPLALGSAFHRRRLRLVSSQVSTLDPAITPRWDRARRTAMVMQLLCDLPLGELITHRIPFGSAPEAYALLESSPQEVLQVVLTHV